ncbi:MAG: HD domain-containing protein [Oscillospiraceae bacterium]|nr:HD domain-containing protein [Oscillospiraceae bacterium]
MTDAIEQYMRDCMCDSAHDTQHVYRVLNYAMDIAAHEPGVDPEILRAACLLHDIGRAEQYADPRVDHAACGAEKARAWLEANGHSADFARAVGGCILAHRFRSGHPPASLEAKILFDADKLDACGAMGIARTLLYNGIVGLPLYMLGEGGAVLDGTADTQNTFFREYKFKLEKLYGRFYTERGEALAQSRRKAAREFYEALLREARECHGIKLITQGEPQ